MFPVSHQKSHNVFELYIITQYATVIFIRYDTEKLIILDPIKINGKVKELFQDGNNKIDQIVVGENLSNSWGGPGLTLLIGEQQLLCQIRIQDDPELILAGQPQFNDIINEQELPLCVGLASIEFEAPKELCVNNQGSYILVSSENQI